MAARKRKAPSLPLDGPTPQRLQHSEFLIVPTDRAGAFARVAQSPISRYAARGEITERQASAAERLYRDYVRGIIGVSDAERTGFTGVRLPHGPGVLTFTEHRLAAIEAFQRAIAAMGATLAATVLRVVVDEQTAEEVARARCNGGGDNELRRLRDAAKWALRCGLDVLADHYGYAVDFVPHQLLSVPERLLAEARARH